MRYIINKVSKKMTPADWLNVAGVTLVDNSDGSPSKYHTVAKLVYDDECLQYWYECQDDEIKCSMRGYNQPLYDEETVEFFIAPTDISKYLELEWNGIGGEFCAYVDNDMAGKTSLSFVPRNPIDTTYIYNKDGWSVYGKIPLKLFDNKPVGEWHFNAYRIKRNSDNSMYLMAYSPTMVENFHKPHKFAILEFSKED